MTYQGLAILWCADVWTSPPFSGKKDVGLFTRSQGLTPWQNAMSVEAYAVGGKGL